jgi:hypothetical protein
MPLIETKTSKGKPGLRHDSFLFRKTSTLQSGVNAWRCTEKTCNVSLKTTPNNTNLVEMKGSHKHKNSAKQDSPDALAGCSVVPVVAPESPMISCLSMRSDASTPVSAPTTGPLTLTPYLTF